MVDNLKDLEKLLKLCRKQGVSKINLGSVSFELGDLPHRHTEVVDEMDSLPDPLEGFPEGELTPEELTFFANGGLPEDNPYRGRN